VLDRDELILHRSRFLHRPFQHRHELAASPRLRTPADLGPAIQFRLHLPAKLRQIHAHLFQDRAGHAVLLVEQGRQQMQGINLGMPLFHRQLLRPLDRFLRLDGQFVKAKCHTPFSCPLACVSSLVRDAARYEGSHAAARTAACACAASHSFGMSATFFCFTANAVPIVAPAANWSNRTIHKLL